MGTTKSPSGFTLIEVLVAIGVLAVIFAVMAPMVLVKAESHRRVIEGAIPALIAESLQDAILVGAQENYDSAGNAFFFDFEGIRVQIVLPGVGENPIHLPFNATPQKGLYPVGPVYFTAEHMVVNGVDLGKQTDAAGNEIEGEFVGLPIDEDQNGNGTLDLGEDVNGNCVLDTGEDSNSNGRLDGSEDFNCSGFLDSFETDANANGILETAEDLNGDGFWGAPDRRIQVGPYLPYRSDFYRDYGYTLEIFRPTVAPKYQFTVRVFSRFFDVWRGLKSVPYPVLKAYAEPEVGADLADCGPSGDDDGDGESNDLPVYSDKPAGTPLGGTPPPCGTHSWKGSPETLLNGVDDDADGVIDDGVIMPSREVSFTIDL